MSDDSEIELTKKDIVCLCHEAAMLLSSNASSSAFSSTSATINAKHKSDEQKKDSISHTEIISKIKGKLSKLSILTGGDKEFFSIFVKNDVLTVFHESNMKDVSAGIAAYFDIDDENEIESSSPPVDAQDKSSSIVDSLTRSSDSHDVGNNYTSLDILVLDEKEKQQSIKSKPTLIVAPLSAKKENTVQLVRVKPLSESQLTKLGGSSTSTYLRDGLLIATSNSTTLNAPENPNRPQKKRDRDDDLEHLSFSGSWASSSTPKYHRKFIQKTDENRELKQKDAKRQRQVVIPETPI